MEIEANAPPPWRAYRVTKRDEAGEFLAEASTRDGPARSHLLPRPGRWKLAGKRGWTVSQGGTAAFSDAGAQGLSGYFRPTTPAASMLTESPKQQVRGWLKEI
jgi:hypothetical protein